MENKKTLLHFLFSRTGFGRTSWSSFAAIAIMVGMMVWYALFSGSDDTPARIVVGLFAISITCIMAYGTYRNFKGKQA